MTIVASQNVSSLTPDESTREYTVKYVLIGAILQGLAQLGPFFAIFFAVRGPNDEWPYAWWAFLWIFLAGMQGYQHLQSSPARVVVRNNTTVEFVNYFKTSLYNGEQAMAGIYETVAVGQGCLGGKCAVFVRTDEHMAAMKQKHCCCAWCIGKQYRLCLNELAAFQNDFAMGHGDVSGDTALKKASDAV